MLVFIVSYFIIIPHKPVCFLTRDRKDNGSRWEERKGGTGKSRGGETMVRIHYMRKNVLKEREKCSHGSWHFWLFLILVYLWLYMCVSLAYSCLVYFLGINSKAAHCQRIVIVCGCSSLMYKIAVVIYDLHTPSVH